MDGSKPRILFVDDDSNLLAGLKRSLRVRGEGWEISLLESAEVALRSHESYPYQVVVTDMLMPGMGGLALVQALNNSRVAPRCIVLTGMSDLNAASQLINTCEVFRFYTKPCPRDELASAIEAALSMVDVQVPAVTAQVDTRAPAVVLEREILDSLSRGVLVVDSHARPVYMNQPATALVAQRRGLSLDMSGVLRAASRSETLRLHQALASVMGGREGGNSMAALTLDCAGSGPPLMLVVTPAAEEIDPSCHHVIMFISGLGPVQAAAPSSDMIATMLGVTYTEARLVEKLAKGQNLERAADEMGVTLSSARTYLKRVQKKTGTSRQVDLVRLVLDIPLP